MGKNSKKKIQPSHENYNVVKKREIQ